MQIELRCPSCRNQQFADIGTQPDDYVGSRCPVCGYVLTEKDMTEMVEAALAKKLEKKLSGDSG